MLHQEACEVMKSAGSEFSLILVHHGRLLLAPLSSSFSLQFEKLSRCSSGVKVGIFQNKEQALSLRQ